MDYFERIIVCQRVWFENVIYFFLAILQYILRSLTSQGTDLPSSARTDTRPTHVSPSRTATYPRPAGVEPGCCRPPPALAASSASPQLSSLRPLERRGSLPEPPPLCLQVTTSMTTYNYSSSSGSRPEPPRTPPPHRSPSPVSFPMHPEPMANYSYRREELQQRSRSRSPPPRPFPTSVHTYQVGLLKKFV